MTKTPPKRGILQFLLLNKAMHFFQLFLKFVNKTDNV